MPNSPSQPENRRDFLTGKALRRRIEQAGEAIADHLLDVDGNRLPSAGPTVRLATDAMACEFSVIMNPGPVENVSIASDALEMLQPLEEQMSAYQPSSEISQLNAIASAEKVQIKENLFQLLLQCKKLSDETAGAFDATSGPLIALWRQCRQAGNIPSQKEIDDCLQQTGMQHIVFDEETSSVQFDCGGVELNLGGIGKGYALDCLSYFLQDNGMAEHLVHGGQSSLLAKGDHHQQGGWPISIRNPLFTEKKLATILMRDQALATSGSNVQFFRHAGKRYGHILDPRTGYPVHNLLSVTVLAPSAAIADGLSTAFFVLGLEKTLEYCHNQKEIGVLLVPPPLKGRQLEPVVYGIPQEFLFATSEDVHLQYL